MRTHYNVGFIFLNLWNQLELLFRVQGNLRGNYRLSNYSMGGYKDHVKKAIKNLLHKNIDVHSRRLISKFPGDAVKCIYKLQYICENKTFADRCRYNRLFQQVTHKGGGLEMSYIKIFQNAQDLSVSVGYNYTEY